MTQCCFYFAVFLPAALLHLLNYYGPASALRIDPVYLQCTETVKENAVTITTCGIDSRILVEVQYGSLNSSSIVQFNCYNSTPMKFNLQPEKIFPKVAEKVTFNSCRFSENDNILEILKNSLELSKTWKIDFNNQLIDNSLSRANLRGLSDIVYYLEFTIRNVSTLPTDLFADSESLPSLLIDSNSNNSSHLSLLLAPLKKLYYLTLKIKNLQGISETIFGNKKKLQTLSLKSNNITALPSGIFSNLSKMYRIDLEGNSFPSNYPEEPSLETKNRKEFHLNENGVVLKKLPQSLLRDLPLLEIVTIINCQLESIPSDIFYGLKKIWNIVIQGNNLHELPVGLFADQENLKVLDLSKNMIRTLVDGLLNKNNQLDTLDLSDNQLTNLSNGISKTLTKLGYLNLENNNLLTISSHHNQPPHGFSIFDNLTQLIKLNLKNNSINDIPYRLMINSKMLMNLDLSFNTISSINCNFVTYFHSNINLTGNPINCDCRVMCLHQHIIEKLMQYDFKSSPIRCESPSVLKGRLLNDLKPNDLLCNISKRCTYNIRATDSVLVMNCSGGNFTDIPLLPTFNQSFHNGIELFMDNNPLTELSSRTLKDNINISLLSINGSRITKLPQRFFSNLSKLRNVSLVLPLEEISNGMFDDSPAITTITISGTNMSVLPKLYLFQAENLILLNLSKNRFRIINDFNFISHTKLETLLLSHNLVESLPWLTFSGLLNLKTLFLNNNYLQYIHPDVFEDTPSLEFINVENNQLKTIQPFVKLLGTLQTLLMRNNSIGNDFFIGIQQFSPSILDLSLNNISSIDLSHLRSINKDNFFFNFSYNNIEAIKFTNGNMSINCDCKIISFKKDNEQMNMNEILQCLSPYSLIERKTVNFALEELLCPMNSICPKNCHCLIRPVNSTLIVNCSNAGLTEVPQLPELETIFKNGIELWVHNNNLTSLNPHSQSGYKGVTKLFAAHNQITNIFSEDIPEKMSHFDVSYNRIERLDEKVIKVINESQTLRSVLLYHNRIICDCSSEYLTRFISLNKTLFPDIDQCSDGKKFITLSYTEICRSSNKLDLISKLCPHDRNCLGAGFIPDRIEKSVQRSTTRLEFRTAMETVFIYREA